MIQAKQLTACQVVAVVDSLSATTELKSIYQSGIY